jgi:DNA-binding transcriptional LysR family regulator
VRKLYYFAEKLYNIKLFKIFFIIKQHLALFAGYALLMSKALFKPYKYYILHNFPKLGALQMDEKDWIFLQALYDEKNLTRTAHRLFISQPALTYRLNQLEEELDIKVFIRGKGNIKFTQEGEHLAQYAKKMLQELHALKTQLKDMRPPVPKLNIAASGKFSYTELPAILSSFSELYPETKFNIGCDSFGTALDLLHKEKDYIAFIHGDFEFDGFKWLLRENMVCVLSKNYISLEDLPKLPRIMPKMSSCAKKHHEKWWDENFKQPPLIGVLTEKSQNCVELVKQGLGYAILPLSQADRLLLQGSIHILPLMNADGTPLLHNFYLYCGKEAAKLTTVKKFIKFIKHYYKIENVN